MHAMIPQNGRKFLKATTSALARSATALDQDYGCGSGLRGSHVEALPVLAQLLAQRPGLRQDASLHGKPAEG